VSGSKEPRLPIDVDEVDLTAPARNAWLLGDDQVGHTSVAGTLDFWARDWREARGGLERLPDPFVPALASWLLRRVDDAMGVHLAIDEFFHDVRRTHGALRGQLGLVDVPDYKRGVPCPKCETLALYRANGSEWVECGACGSMLTTDEYDTYVAALAAQMRQERAA
jgi:Zn ribbon nucleic-acid-binding protein